MNFEWLNIENVTRRREIKFREVCDKMFFFYLRNNFPQWLYSEIDTALTSRRVDVHLEPPVGGDNAVHVVIVQVLNMVAGRVVQTQLLQGHRYLP